MPSDCNTDVFSHTIEKHSVMRKYYNVFSSFFLLKNIIIKRELAICTKRKKGAQHVLYPGFGIGQLLSLFSNESKYNVLAIDKNNHFVANSTAFFYEENVKNIYCKTDDITQITYQNNFDYGLCVNLLNYIEEDGLALKNLYNSLKPAGVLIIFNASNYADYKDIKLETGIYKDQKFRNGYSIDEMRDKLKKAGFAKVKIRYVYGVPGILSWKITTGLPSLWIKKSKLFYFLLPFYSLLLLPVVMLLNFIEIAIPHKQGKCIIVKAFK